jgi:hypothetical protein
MSEAFIASAAYLPVEPGQPRADVASAVLQSLLRSAGLLAKRIPEIHWQVPPRAAAAAGAQRGQEYDIDALGPWLIQVAQRLSFAPELAAFLWPAAPLLDHYILQSAARSLQTRQRDLIIVGQFSGPLIAGDGLEQAGALLLASPAAIGRHNLGPRARIAAALSISAGQGGLLSAASTALKHLSDRERAARQPLPANKNSQQHILPLPDQFESDQPGEEIEPERFDLPSLDEISWLASAAPNGDLSTCFPQARWLKDRPPAAGAVLILNGLLSTLEHHPDQWGLLVSSGPQETGLATLIERI